MSWECSILTITNLLKDGVGGPDTNRIGKAEVRRERVAADECCGEGGGYRRSPAGVQSPPIAGSRIARPDGAGARAVPRASGASRSEVTLDSALRRSGRGW
eukprot:COSAG03_NODE_42_length_17101_cov_8.739031_14_plen_101_part_00